VTLGLSAAVSVSSDAASVVTEDVLAEDLVVVGATQAISIKDKPKRKIKRRYSWNIEPIKYPQVKIKRRKIYRLSIDERPGIRGD
jgi:hypothetical protein